MHLMFFHPPVLCANVCECVRICVCVGVCVGVCVVCVLYVCMLTNLSVLSHEHARSHTYTHSHTHTRTHTHHIHTTYRYIHTLHPLTHSHSRGSGAELGALCREAAMLALARDMHTPTVRIRFNGSILTYSITSCSNNWIMLDIHTDMYEVRDLESSANVSIV